ncbi:hypothetical protein [Bacillus sp. T33-2]|nr:hypothetical protein [Bacillus sp. T33-2]
MKQLLDLRLPHFGLVPDGPPMNYTVRDGNKDAADTVVRIVGDPGPDFY